MEKMQNSPSGQSESSSHPYLQKPSWVSQNWSIPKKVLFKRKKTEAYKKKELKNTWTISGFLATFSTYAFAGNLTCGCKIILPIVFIGEIVDFYLKRFLFYNKN